jgi:tetratricopeptide (TPR) repeat protein
LIPLTAGVWMMRRKWPFVLVGWFWFLGMLVPVAGIMQTENQSYADRYTYLPEIGLCIAIAWLAAGWAGKDRNRRTITGCFAGISLAALLAAGWHQVGYWRSSEVLWRHTIASTGDNFLAHNNLGNALLRQGRVEEAVLELRESVRINPDYPKAFNDLGTALFQEGLKDEAMVQYREALRRDPRNANAYNNLGDALASEGRIDDAITDYREALSLDPTLLLAHNNLGNALFQQGHLAEGIVECRTALSLDPASVDAQNSLAWMLSTASDRSLRDGPAAVALAQRAYHSTGGADPIILRTLAAAFAQSGDYSSAVEAAQNAMQLAESQSKFGMTASLQKELSLYEAGRTL